MTFLPRHCVRLRRTQPHRYRDDPGELGVVAVAPAIANALFSAIGLRFRRLPLLGDDL